MQRKDRAAEVFLRRFHGLGRGEWAAVALLAAGIVGVNKLVIHDAGNTWSGLVVVSFYAGILAVHGWRKLIRRRQPSSGSTREHGRSSP